MQTTDELGWVINYKGRMRDLRYSGLLRCL